MKAKTRKMIGNLQIFCDSVGWYLINAVPNVKKNPNQVLAVIYDKRGRKIDLLVSENERYYQLLGNKKSEEINKKKMLQEHSNQKPIL